MIFFMMHFKKIYFIPSSRTHKSFYTAIKMYKSKPLTGHGSKSFIFKCNEKEFQSGGIRSTHPHNIYLQLLAENGLMSF